uniref:Putative aspartate aminotransferase YhdR n=1 Tax=Zeugodacus cucurbitae TaxID=28588 RepID=A0A0A1XSP0_ZEUCU
MSRVNFILYLYAFVAGCTVVSACKLSIQSPAPLFAQNLGSKKIIFKSQDSAIELYIGESITAYCSSGLIYKKSDDPYGYSSNTNQVLSSNTAEINCDSNNKIGIKGIINVFATQITVQCKSKTNYDIYESERILPNCENYVTYAIGAPIELVGSDIKVGICYDLDNLKLKFVSYIAQSNSETFVLDEKRNPNELSVDLSRKIRSLKTYFPFMSQDTFNAARNQLRKTQTLFDAFEFDFTSLLQDESLMSPLESHAYIFNTMWWRQLRQHNWRYFFDALKERTQSVKYLVHLGTYGNMTAPTGNCDLFKHEIVAVHKDNLAITAPAYIWAYLKAPPAADGVKKEDIVVIAYNSPYASNPTHEEFCDFDVCDEVEWLKNSTFGNLRRLATLGYMFCCRPEDVALIIDYFPIQQDKHEITKSGEVELTHANVSQPAPN